MGDPKDYEAPWETPRAGNASRARERQDSETIIHGLKKLLCHRCPR